MSNSRNPPISLRFNDNDTSRRNDSIPTILFRESFSVVCRWWLMFLVRTFKPSSTDQKKLIIYFIRIVLTSVAYQLPQNYHNSVSRLHRLINYSQLNHLFTYSEIKNCFYVWEKYINRARTCNTMGQHDVFVCAFLQVFSQPLRCIFGVDGCPDISRVPWPWNAVNIRTAINT